MFSVDKDNNISLTRGDTCTFNIDLVDADGNPYVTHEGDTMRFAMAKNYGTNNPLVNKNIPVDTLIFKLDPQDTKELEFGQYVYDIQFTDHNGDVSTILLGRITLTKEVA